MTNAQLYSYLCKECNKRVEYYVPIEVYWQNDEDTTWRIIEPKRRKEYKQNARYTHNMTHKGEMDAWLMQ